MRTRPSGQGLQRTLRYSWHRIAVAFVTALLAGIFIGPLHAEYPSQYVATAWQTEQGLPQNSVNAILQDRQGYLWIGTFGGLARFDGERFTVFDSLNTPGFRGAQILSLYESRSGALWIGSVAGGLIRMENGSATAYAEREGLPSNFISSIRSDAQGNVWVNTSGGLARFDGAKLQPYPAHRGKPVREFYLEARDGSMWFRSGQEVLRFGPDGSVTSLNAHQPSVFLVNETRDGSVWIVVRDQYRLVRYSQGVFSDVPLPAIDRRQWLSNDFAAFSVTTAVDSDRNLLLLTPAGLVRIVGGGPTPPEPIQLPVNGGELPKTRSLLVDREGNLWVGLIGAGLVRLRPAPLRAYGKPEGLSDSSFNTVFQDRERRIWLGGDLVYWFDGHRFHLLPGVRDIRAIAQTRDGDLWFGGYGGLYRWRSGALTRFQVDAPMVSAIYQDREGILWVGGVKENRPGGLYRFHDGTFDRIPGISDVGQMIEDREDGLWVAGREGLFHVQGGNAIPYQSNQPLPSLLRSFCRDATGAFWLASYGEGLFRLRDGRLKAITQKHGLPSNMLVGILNDGLGNLWLSSNQNIFRVSLQELNDFADSKIASISPVSYGIAEGMRSSECNGGSPGVWKTADGRIWFPTLRGVVAIDPGVGSRLPPPVVVEEASANRFPLPRGGNASVPPGNNTFDFQFTALSLTAPEKLRFRYRLEPYDKEWVDAGTRRIAHYTNMAPGEYSFRVIAANSLGVWNREGAGIHFVLRPHYYQTNWFYALCSIGFLALLWVAYQFRLSQLRSGFDMRLRERVDERTRIARELHDSLLQSFQGNLYRFQAARNLFARSPDEALKTLDSAIARAESALAEGRDAIQNLRTKPAQSRFEDLLTATGQELRDSSGQSTAFQVIVEGQPQSLSPLLQDEIYRIAREVLRNAFQHAGASRIEAVAQYDPRLFRLRIRDDGKGIDPKILSEGARAGHWGLPGIRERAKRIGAQLQLWSENGAGTEVELTVPASIAFGFPIRRRFGLFRVKGQAG